ncbi:tail completion protein gp17 [Sandarakinorhabdus sp.]|uniref:tail completion protein gp17 n=1 Tax=Sandarakinorhabdus sp. TaxID=1916663 RepID=UPI003F71C7F3
MSASLAVQSLVVAALADLPGLTGVYDGPPADAVAPYAVIGPDLVTDWSSKTETGHAVRLVVTIWDDRHGAARLRALLGAAEVRLRALAGVRDGARIVVVQLLRSGVGAAQDGWRPGSIEIRVLTHEQ